ncbi:hypothetical protein OROHE_012841 [Orobanche hederae]
MGDHLVVEVFICLFLVLNAQLVNGARFVNVTLIETALSKGAVCLDGSPPAYAIDKGSGCGSNNWLVYIEGGAWCHSNPDCADRSTGMFGSSTKRNRLYFSGILDQNQSFNPDFYNWNRVYLVYCDGSSFLGDADGIDPETKTKLYYRGSRVFDAVMEELLDKGMNTAVNAILAGGSAGGLATILHCDSFHALLPNTQRVKCISDSGFFLHAQNLPGAKEREDYFTKVVELHGLEAFLPASCTSKMNPGLCLFPENLVEEIQTPLFLLESSFDKYQLKDMLTPYIGGGKPEWNNCLNQSLTYCNSTQLETIQEFQKIFIQTLQNLDYSSMRGMFVHTCYLHCHLLEKNEWKCSSVVNNVLIHKTVADAIGDWYFDRSRFQQVDTCNNLPRNCTSTLSADSDAFNRKCFLLMD